MSAFPATELEDGLLITAEGYEQLCIELETLRTDARRELSERLREARQDGDLADNPALLDLLEEQAQLERRISVLEGQVAAAQIAAPAADGRAWIGSCVRVSDLAVGEIAEYELVGAIEPNVGNGRVSIAAPVGRALVGQRPGAQVDVVTPRGTIKFEILSVGPPNFGPVAETAA